MTAYVFAGPTIGRNEVTAICDCVCLPPAAQGDLYRAALTRPRAIGLIDGYFHGAASVWHKEILWAMAQGIHVFGCASMGALRAAELHCFGMRGVGRIFEDYRDGRLQDDDEVAVLHAPAEAGFVPTSEPMVNIRATLVRAQSQGVIDAEVAERLRRIAKGQFYRQRSWEAILAAEDAQALPARARAALGAWLPVGRVDLKRNDAEEMLGAMKHFLASEPTPVQTTYDFEWTHLWDAVTARGVGQGPIDLEDNEGMSRERLLDELRLDPDLHDRVGRNALLRLLVEDDARRRQSPIDRKALQERKSAFRWARGLVDRATLDDWLVRNSMDESELDRLVEDELRIDALMSERGGDIEASLLAELRSSGKFERLLARAQCKEDALSAIGLSDAQLGDLDEAPAQLLAWFFETRLQRAIPDDIEATIRKLGFSHRNNFYRFILRERVYSDLEISV